MAPRIGVFMTLEELRTIHAAQLRPRRLPTAEEERQMRAWEQAQNRTAEPKFA